MHIFIILGMFSLITELGLAQTQFNNNCVACIQAGNWYDPEYNLCTSTKPGASYVKGSYPFICFNSNAPPRYHLDNLIVSFNA
jgi:hypothetical protein